MSRFGKTSALLQKVSSTLRGEKNVQEDDDEGLGAYLSGLGKKSATPVTSKKKEIDWEKFDEVNDLSEDEHTKKKSSPETKVGATGSKFLKKKTPLPGKAVTEKKDYESKQKSAALSKAMGFSSKFESKPQHEFLRMSDSDMDLSFSMDGHILGDVESLTPAKTPRGRSLDKSGSEDSMSIGRGGSKFLKKQSAVEIATTEQHSPIRKQPKAAVPEKSLPVQRQPMKQMPSQKGVPAQQSSQQFKAPNLQQHKTLPATQQHNYGIASKSKEVNASFEIDTDSSTMSIGKGGSKFLKKKPAELKLVVSPKSKDTTPKTKEKDKKPSVESPTTNKKRDMFSLKSAERYSTTVKLDSEEESFQGYIQDLASTNSDVSLKTPPKSPKTPKSILKTPRTPRSLTPLEDIDETEEKHNNQTLSDEDDSFKINVMDFDDLDPPEFSPPEAKNTSTPKPGVKKSLKDNKKSNKSASKKQKKERVKKKKISIPESDDDDLFAKMGLQTVDDLLGDQKIIITDSDIGTDIEREEDEDDYYRRAKRTPSPLRSILSPSPKPDRTPRSGRTPRVTYSLDEVTEIRSRSPSPEIVSSAPASRSASMVYTADFDDDSESVIKTEEPSETEDSVISEHIGSHRSFRKNRSRTESEYYSDDFVSATESRWTSKRKEYAMSRSESLDSEHSMFSDTFSEFSDSRTDTRKSSRSHSPQSRRKSKKRKEAQVQTGASISDIAYKWIPEQAGVAYVSPGYGLSNLDPKLVATHVVSADALEALSSYSPSVLALNDMLRQQLQLTENYANIQKHLHQSLIHSTQPDFIYTTLEDTKRYIKKHKRPTLTFDQALQQVKQEMGIE